MDTDEAVIALTPMIDQVIMTAQTSATLIADVRESSAKFAHTKVKSSWGIDARELLDRVASTEPIPGGGSVSIVVACVGTALLRKSFLISLQKERERRNQRCQLEVALAKVEGYEASLQMAADQNANASAKDACDRGLSRYDFVEGELSQSLSETALVDRASLILSFLEKMHSLLCFTLEQLPSMHDVTLSDAITGIKLLNSATEGLLLSATNTLSSISDLAVRSAMNRQIREMRHWPAQWERQLDSCLQGRSLTRS